MTNNRKQLARLVNRAKQCKRVQNSAKNYAAGEMTPKEIEECIYWVNESVSLLALSLHSLDVLLTRKIG